MFLCVVQGRHGRLQVSHGTAPLSFERISISGLPILNQVNNVCDTSGIPVRIHLAANLAPGR